MASGDVIEIIGLIAAALTTSGFVPQVYKTWRTRDVGGLSFWMYLALFSGTVLWLIYGIYTESRPIILANIVASTLTFIMLVFIFIGKFRR
ncbi:SemiSWEET family sugar transporter [Aureitalea marina]|uniref:Glutathione synthetase n=1 Tax=Aureitalea marina TaxID=930804 RepID=A0A2S7KT71_9FLAO|nr:SemiSWEET transporter [Aureitalea marina]PQB05821.1 hypothetical protein BST85_13630 [Aureitalea marina]